MIQAKRAGIPHEYREQAANQAANLFIHHPLFLQHERFACYFPYQDEFDSVPLIKAICQAQKKCYLPILTEEKTLEFVRYRDGDPLKLNRFSIPEPENLEQQIPADQLDVVLTPLIAFDPEGHRLGTGGGYYDRTFAFLAEKTTPKPLLIGLAYQDQEIPLLPADCWDIPLDGIVTEKKIIVF